MNFLLTFFLASLQFTVSLCAPINVEGIAGRSAVDNGLNTDLVARQHRGGNKGKPSAAAVQKAANNFAGDVATVSNSLNNMGTTKDTAGRKSLATAGFNAESDENAQRAVLFAAGNNKAANTKIVDNTPTVLNGLKSIMKNPSIANTAKQVQMMELARNANILPSITSLTNSAFQATNVNAQAKKFQPTTGTQRIKQANASGGNKGGIAASNAQGSKKNNRSDE